MILKPMVRNHICLNAHPEGCRAEVRSQAARVLAFRERLTHNSKNGRHMPENLKVLVIGCSTGYGLASRLAASLGYGADTVGFSLEKEPTATRPGTPGWYFNQEFDHLAKEQGRLSITYGTTDAFSHEAKQLAIQAALEHGFRYDLVIYSLASPVRTDPDTGVMYRSVIKPIGRPYSGRTIDVFTGRMFDATVQPATEQEISETVKVMGGEDWLLWIRALRNAGVLAEHAVTLAYSYIGPQLSWPIYRDGTIGKAKAHLEATASLMNEEFQDMGLQAYVSINKAVVTRASAVIPVIPLYVSTLFKVMKERGIHEDCVDQMLRLFNERLYRRDGNPIPVDAEGRIRIDDLEMGATVQQEVQARLARIDESNVALLADIEGFRTDFLRIHGFEVPGVDYDTEVSSFA